MTTTTFEFHGVEAIGGDWADRPGAPGPLAVITIRTNSGDLTRLVTNRAAAKILADTIDELLATDPPGSRAK